MDSGDANAASNANAMLAAATAAGAVDGAAAAATIPIADMEEMVRGVIITLQSIVALNRAQKSGDPSFVEVTKKLLIAEKHRIDEELQHARELMMAGNATEELRAEQCDNFADYLRKAYGAGVKRRKDIREVLTSMRQRIHNANEHGRSDLMQELAAYVAAQPEPATRRLRGLMKTLTDVQFEVSELHIKLLGLENRMQKIDVKLATARRTALLWSSSWCERFGLTSGQELRAFLEKAAEDSA